MSSGTIVAPTPPEAEPDFVGMEVQALSSLVTDLAAAFATIAPGVLDRTLHIARLRLQLLDTGRRPAVIEDEITILRFKISMLEIALGRGGTAPLAANAEVED